MSSPRSTWVTRISASSTGFTRVYSGCPLARTTTKSGTVPALKVISPRTMSVKEMSASGIRRRQVGSRPSDRKAAFCSSVSSRS